MFYKIGLRNAVRNKRRTLIASTAIGVGVAAMILADAFVIGMADNMIDGATETFQGHVQVHHSDFRVQRDVDLVVPDKDIVINKIESDSRVFAKSERAFSIGMISSPTNGVNVGIYGVDFISEKRTSRLSRTIKEGKYPVNSESNHVTIGANLADKLDVRLGERVVITVAESRTGELSQVMVKVGTIFKFGDRGMDGQVIFLPIQKLQKMLNINNSIHEVAILLNDGVDEDKFSADLSLEGVETVTWRALAPSISNTVEMMAYSTSILALVVIVVGAFGIINAIFMSVYERFHEFGVMKSIGTNPTQIVGIIAAEAFGVGVFGGILGVIITAVVGYYTSKYGIDYSEIEIGTMSLMDPIRTVFNFKQFIIFPFGAAVFTVLVSLYPAVWVARLSPISAIKRAS